MTATGEPIVGGATSDPPSYPLVIRIDHTAFERLAANNINERGRVDRWCWGRRLGESHTQGTISVLLVPDRNDASFDIIFQGPHIDHGGRATARP